MLSTVHIEIYRNYNYDFVNSCYWNPSFQRFGPCTLLSDEDCQQGVPLGPLLFYASVMLLINRLQSTFNVWYMDDGTIGDNADVLLNDFQLLIAEGKNLGLNFNSQHC